MILWINLLKIENKWISLYFKVIFERFLRSFWFLFKRIGFLKIGFYPQLIWPFIFVVKQLKTMKCLAHTHRGQPVGRSVDNINSVRSCNPKLYYYYYYYYISSARSGCHSTHQFKNQFEKNLYIFQQKKKKN